MCVVCVCVHVRGVCVCVYVCRVEVGTAAASEIVFTQWPVFTGVLERHRA